METTVAATGALCLIGSCENGRTICDGDIGLRYLRPLNNPNLERIWQSADDQGLEKILATNEQTSKMWKNALVSGMLLAQGM
jgi:hypothetical protein